MTLLGEYLSVKEMITVERNSVALGLALQELMECAGKSVADQVMKKFDPDSKVIIVSGLSGNGGDGFVAARHLASSGYDVEVLVLGDPSNIRHENSKINYQILEKMKSSIKITKITDTSFIPELRSDVIIDGLIGTSMHGSLRTPYKEMVSAINGTDAYTVSIDIPTGMVADTGKVHGEAINADLTVTFHKAKEGYRVKGENVGELEVAPIGIPLEAELYTGPGDVWAAHKRRDPEAHKGMFGTLLVVGGSETYSGAPTLTSLGAYSMGVDLVYTAVPETATQTIMSTSPSLITIKLKGERFCQEHIEVLEPLLEKVDAVAIGPGLGRHKDTVDASTEFFKILQNHGLPCIIDADGLKAYADVKISISTPTIFTPHSREFQLLTGEMVSGSFEDRGEIVGRHAAKLGAVILLKGKIDVISDGKLTRYNWTGNPGMTVGGTGDVLTGITGGFVAQGTSLMEASSAAAYINGAAGDWVYKEKGYHILPEDLIEKIPYIIQKCLG
ncbi:NAD(P)H-hydrate dehydratase [Candidatus Bathyarchaeota archaeon]|nr:NAD(P)H-hydrate dehydratase [Candidatus Bathyarchaeota archaeon]